MKRVQNLSVFHLLEFSFLFSDRDVNTHAKSLTKNIHVCLEELIINYYYILVSYIIDAITKLYNIS